MLETELEVAIRLAQKAGNLINKYYEEGFETEEKLGADNYREPVTVADREASRLIVDGLAEAFPSDAIVSEEEADDFAARREHDRTWIIDPIDGTAGFVNHDGDFAVQIGLAERGRPVLGVVLLPFHGVLNFATLGGGSFARIGDEESVRVQVSGLTEFSSLGIAVSRNHPSSRMQQIIAHFGFKNAIRRGSVGLKVSLIASRAADVYIHPSPRTKLWDTCAPQIILEEAGGKMTDLFGLPLVYDRHTLQNHNGIVASNGAVHSSLIKHLSPLLAEFGRVPYRY